MQKLAVKTYQLQRSINLGGPLVPFKPSYKTINLQQGIKYVQEQNKYFKSTKDYRELLEYSTKAVKNFLEKIGNKVDNFELNQHVDNFFDDVTKKNTTKFKIMRNAKGEICGGFSTHIDKKEKSLHISSFYLDDNSKKKNVIKELLEDIKKRAQKHKCESITADIVGDKQLKRSERMGFSEKKKTFLQTLMEWNVINKYILKNKEVTCPVDKFATNWFN